MLIIRMYGVCCSGSNWGLSGRAYLLKRLPMLRSVVAQSIRTFMLLSSKFVETLGLTQSDWVAGGLDSCQRLELLLTNFVHDA